MNIISAISDASSTGLMVALTGLIYLVTQILTTWYSNYKRDKIAIVQNNKLNEIHDLSNGAMKAQKQLLANTARAKALITNSEADLKAADQADKDLAEHEATLVIASANKKEEEKV